MRVTSCRQSEPSRTVTASPPAPVDGEVHGHLATGVVPAHAGGDDAAYELALGTKLLDSEGNKSFGINPGLDAAGRGAVVPAGFGFENGRERGPRFPRQRCAGFPRRSNCRLGPHTRGRCRRCLPAFVTEKESGGNRGAQKPCRWRRCRSSCGGRKIRPGAPGARGPGNEHRWLPGFGAHSPSTAARFFLRRRYGSSPVSGARWEALSRTAALSWAARLPAVGACS